MAALHLDEIKLQQVAQLMQPALIRLFDQVRKHLERSSWSGTYETIELWPEGTTEQDKQTFAQVQQNLLTAKGEQLNALEDALAALPQPQLMYLLQLSQDNQQRVQVNLWELCYQICFYNYVPVLERTEIADFPISEIQVDTELIVAGEVDWNRLDDKAQAVVEQMFQNLPAPS